MNWFYFRDDTTNVEVRRDRKEQRIRVIDPVNRLIVNETGINLVRVIRTCSTYLNKKIDLEGDDE